MRNHQVNKNNIVLFYVATKPMSNLGLGFTVVGRMDPLINKLECLLPFLRN